MIEDNLWPYFQGGIGYDPPQGGSSKYKGCFNEVSRIFHASFMDWKFQGCFKKVSGVFQGRLRGVLRIFQKSSKDEILELFGWSFHGVLRKFQGCYI